MSASLSPGWLSVPGRGKRVGIEYPRKYACLGKRGVTWKSIWAYLWLRAAALARSGSAAPLQALAEPLCSPKLTVVNASASLPERAPVASQ